MATLVHLKDIVPAAQNNINTKFILLDKGNTTYEGPHKTCLSLVADESASVHFQLWGDECDAFQPGDIICLANGIFSYNRSNLVLRAGKRGKAEKVGEFTMVFVETPNMSEIHWVPDPNSAKNGKSLFLYFSHPKVDIFMDADFRAVYLDIKFLQIKLSDQCIDSCPKSTPTAEKRVSYLCQQCEASLQFLQTLCQQKMFRERVIRNKELSVKGGVLLLAHSILKLNISPLYIEYSTVVAAVSRLKSKVLSILLLLCEVENISFLDEAFHTPRSQDLAKSVVSQILELLKAVLIQWDHN